MYNKVILSDTELYNGLQTNLRLNVFSVFVALKKNLANIPILTVLQKLKEMCPVWHNIVCMCVFVHTSVCVQGENLLLKGMQHEGGACKIHNTKGEDIF